VSIYLFVCDDKQGKARAGQGRVARADTRPLDLLATRSNRLGGRAARAAAAGGCARCHFY